MYYTGEKEELVTDVPNRAEDAIRESLRASVFGLSIDGDFKEVGYVPMYSEDLSREREARYARTLRLYKKRARQSDVSIDCLFKRSELLEGEPNPVALAFMNKDGWRFYNYKKDIDMLIYNAMLGYVEKMSTKSLRSPIIVYIETENPFQKCINSYMEDWHISAFLHIVYDGNKEEMRKEMKEVPSVLPERYMKEKPSLEPLWFVIMDDTVESGEEISERAMDVIASIENDCSEKSVISVFHLLSPKSYKK